MSEIFAKRLREVRENARKSQKVLAQYIGVSDVAYGGWERGDAEPSFTNLVKLCRYFNVSADWILGLDKETADARAPLLGRIAAMKDEAEQAAATLRRLSSSIAELEKKV